MTGTFILRPARTTDAGKLGAILTGFARATPWYPELHTGAEDIAHAGRMIDAGWVTVAESAADGVILGFIARNGEEINSLYLAPTAKGAGVGRALIEDAKSRAARLTLWTHEANASARRFYRKQGFVEGERTDGRGNEEGLPDIRLTWERTEAT